MGNAPEKVVEEIVLKQKEITASMHSRRKELERIVFSPDALITSPPSKKPNAPKKRNIRNPPLLATKYKRVRIVGRYQKGPCAGWYLVRPVKKGLLKKKDKSKIIVKPTNLLILDKVI